MTTGRNFEVEDNTKILTSNFFKINFFKIKNMVVLIKFLINNFFKNKYY
jgi:hypothetical protein